jgi:putative PIN family toxin of toxin-antitoxin system
VIGVTLDSNVYISALQYGGIGVRLLGMARAGAIRLDISAAIIKETVGVLRDKFHWDGYGLHFARLELQKIGNVVEPAETLNVTGDPDDNRILECAIASRSDVIITEDKGLLRLGEYDGIKIVRPSEFLQRGIER